VDIVTVREDVWGREVLLGISWDWLWVVVALAFTAIIVHLLIMAVVAKGTRPSPGGKRLSRHDNFDRLFHWTMAISVLVLLFTGVMPVLGYDFAWLTIHWVAGLILTVAVVAHVIRAMFFQDLGSMMVTPTDLKEPFEKSLKPGKYSLAQKGMHHAMTLLILLVIGTGLALFAVIDTPWWSRSNALSEATLGWMFVLHGLSTLGLIGMTALHVYFALRPEKRFYTRSMISGWISEDEYSTNHDPARWMPDETA
jgi:cytochrome b subunit of formate dehydrogenase